MTPQEKAKELFNKMDMIIYTDQDWKSQCIRCAIRAVEEIIKAVAFDNHRTKQKFEYCEGYPDICFASYWEEVKLEINKL